MLALGELIQYRLGEIDGNDPTRRLMVIANCNTNLGEYWQTGRLDFFRFESLSRGFRLGANCMMYGMTH